MIGLYWNKETGLLMFGSTEIANNNGEGIGLTTNPLTRDLFFGSVLIATGNHQNPTGYTVQDGVLYYDGNRVGNLDPIDPENPDSEFSVEGYWIPPEQPANPSVGSLTTADILGMYDAIAATEPRLTKHRYEDADGNPILSVTGSHELFHYVYEPENYTKTLYVQAGIHGNEKDARYTTFKIIEAMLTKHNQSGYKAWKPLYDSLRLILIPVVHPWGTDYRYDTGAIGNMNAPNQHETPTQTNSVNLNRNMDFDHQYALASVGTGDTLPMSYPETRHIRDVVEKYGPHTIDYALDMHDGERVAEHYWVNFPADSKAPKLVLNFLSYLIKTYIPEGTTPVIPNCKDTSTTGITSGWFAKTMGIPASTGEWIAGLFQPGGYKFDSYQFTHSMAIRANLFFMVFNNDVKGWNIEEPQDAQYFRFDYPKAFTKRGMQYDRASAELQVQDDQICARWDALQAKFPNLITKSASLGLNAKGDDVYSYTFGSGTKKVMYVGGVMRYGGTRKIDEFAIYQLVEYLTNDYIVAQSKFLQDLRNNYTIIVLPFIDNLANNTAPNTTAGLNNAALSRQRWVIGVDGKAVPASGAHGSDNHGVKIIKQLIDSHSDLKCIVSGGEVMTGFASNNQTEYSTEFETHIVLPKNKSTSSIITVSQNTIIGENLIVGSSVPNDLNSYVDYLRTNRNELVVVENTQGVTFGDYAFDTFSIPTYFVQLKVSKRFTELAEYHTLTAERYMHANFEAGRRMANIANLFLIGG